MVVRDVLRVSHYTHFTLRRKTNVDEFNTDSTVIMYPENRLGPANSISAANIQITTNTDDQSKSQTQYFMTN